MFNLPLRDLCPSEERAVEVEEKEEEEEEEEEEDGEKEVTVLVALEEKEVVSKPVLQTGTFAEVRLKRPLLRVAEEEEEERKEEEGKDTEEENGEEEVTVLVALEEEEVVSKPVLQTGTFAEVRLKHSLLP